MERLASNLVSKADRGRGIPSGRWGTVRDIADATVFLFSDAGNYVNGTTLVVDGAGWPRQGGLGVGLDPGMEYPEFLVSGEVSRHLKGGRGSKL
jgi:peroxisomal 2,4-dienoyl-CoA reductase